MVRLASLLGPSPTGDRSDGLTTEVNAGEQFGDALRRPLCAPQVPCCGAECGGGEPTHEEDRVRAEGPGPAVAG